MFKRKCLLERIAIYFCIIAMIVLSITVTLNCSYAATSGGIQQNDFLKVVGSNLQNERGEVVVLRGVNFGGWMIQESWMCPVNGADRQWANLDSINAMKNRGFSDEQILELFNTYEDNLITEYDFDRVRELGLNCIRIPFWYRNFMKDENGTWWNADNLNNNPGFKRLDWAIEQAGKRGMYVILDLHGAPGGQNMDHSCGTLGKNELYESQKNRRIMEDLWVKIATRYKGNPVVAAYDIMNEPQNNGGYRGPNSWAPGSPEATSRTNSVYDQMIKAIREVDPDHVITVEAIWEMKALPDPQTMGWTNMMYQMHLYDKSKIIIDYRINEIVEAMNNYGVAGYVGEFNNDSYDCQDYAYQKYNANGISWTMWTYKTGKPQGNWALYGASKEIVQTQSDSFNEIKKKWGSQIQTINGFSQNGTMVNWLSKYAIGTNEDPGGEEVLISQESLTSSIAYLTTALFSLDK